MEQELHFEHGDLTGEISVTLSEGQSLNQLCSKYIHDYNQDRFDAVALRVFIGKEVIVTLYAADKAREGDSTRNPEKVPVKKFKVEGIPFLELFTHLQSLNCTLTTNNYPLEAMEVVNK